MQDENGRWTVCCIRDCDQPPIHGGLCVNHYRRNRKYGSPIATRHAAWRWLKITDEERFWMQVKKSDDCWTWQFGKDTDGYGAFDAYHDNVRHTRAHRFSYALHNGPIPKGLVVMHLCDNRACVRPDHMKLGTAAENTSDMWAKGRYRILRGQATAQARLTLKQAKAILHDPRPYSQLAAEYGVHIQTISSLKNRDSWPELGPEKGAKAMRVSPRRGKSSKGVTPEIVRDIRQSTARGIDLAAKYGLKPQDITDIRKRRSWAHIE